MSILRSLFLIYIAFFTTSCINQNVLKQDSNSLVFIFQNPPDSIYFKTPSGLLVKNNPDYSMLYINKIGLIMGFTPKNGDTLTINSNQNQFIEIEYVYRSIEKVNLLFKSNDTIRVIYEKNGFPHFESIYGDKINENYNLWYTYLRVPSHFDLDAFSLTQSAYLKALYRLKKENPTIFGSKIFQQKRQDFVNIDSLNNMLSKQLNFKISLLDSLNQNNNISPSFYNFYKQILTQRLGTVKNANDQDAHMFSDSLINSIAYHNKLKGYIYSYAKIEKIPLINESNNSYLNYCMLFDSIETNLTQLPSETKNILLYYCLEGISEYFDIKEIKYYSSRYLNTTKDTAKYNFLIQQQGIDLKSGDSLIVESFDGKITNLEKIIDQHKGKVIYVDFWASWCKPCRESMAFATKLRNEYVNKNIVFIYLALNEQKKLWKDAIPQLGLNTNCYNYFIINPKNASIIKDLKVKTIPRYMVFNKQGELINQNAPSPESKEIKVLLNKYIEE